MSKEKPSDADALMRKADDLLVKALAAEDKRHQKYVDRLLRAAGDIANKMIQTGAMLNEFHDDVETSKTLAHKKGTMQQLFWERIPFPKEHASNMMRMARIKEIQTPERLPLFPSSELAAMQVVRLAETNKDVLALAYKQNVIQKKTSAKAITKFASDHKIAIIDRKNRQPRDAGPGSHSEEFVREHVDGGAQARQPREGHNVPNQDAETLVMRIPLKLYDKHQEQILELEEAINKMVATVIHNRFNFFTDVALERDDSR